MRKKLTKKRKPRVIYYPAPQKSRAPYFFTSFFMTIAVALCVAGFLIADINSQKVGWGRDIEVFAVSNSGSKLDVTVMGNNFNIDTGFMDDVQAVLNKIGIAESYLEPAPLRFAEIAGGELNTLQKELLSKLDL